MAYCLANRFPGPPKYFPFYDPGTYQFEKSKLKPSLIPFNSNTPRKTGPSSILWTQACYDASLPTKITNITCLKSKQKRFPYEAFSAEDLEEILCKCGIESPCACAVSSTELFQDIVCQGKVKRRLFKGTVSQSDGAHKNIKREKKDESPPFYNARVNESTAFYQGCKWSHWSSKRGQKSLEERPGPADYSIERKLTREEICNEKFRSDKRKTSRQLRFIEMIQQQNILEGRPGPSSYSPKTPKGTDLQCLGSKAERFPSSKYAIHPGPADHWVRRDFQPLDPPEKPCKAVLPEPSFFGVKATRFVPKIEQGPSPASYNTNYKPCSFLHCPTAGFGSAAVRFKPTIVEESDDEEITAEGKDSSNTDAACPMLSCGFKSKTIRMKPLEKILNEPSPADLPQTRKTIKRSERFQHAAPFYSSEGRFEPWFNEIAVHGRLKTPGPGYYATELPKANSAVNHGPMFRAERFPVNTFDGPAPNEYKVSGGIETILSTHNKRLADNVKNKHTFVWNPPIEKSALTFQEREDALFKKCIALLEPDWELGPKLKSISRIKRSQNKIRDSHKIDSTKKSELGITDENGINKDQNFDELAADEVTKQHPKMLRTFLYTHQMPCY